MISKAETRFLMVKEHHRKSLEKAIAEKKIDPLMINICKFIAGTKNYFTTSTCSGRITLMELDERESKREGAFFRKWHRQVEKKEVWDAIEKYSGKNNLWFKQDAFVFLIGTNSLENAKKLLRICHKSGIKRAGINHFEEGKVHVEIFGTQHMSVPVKKRKEIVINEKFANEMVKIANKKWKMNDEQLQKFCAALKKELE